MIIYSRVILLFFTMLFLNACNTKEDKAQSSSTEQIAYFKDDSKGIKTGGVKMVEINTSKGKFKVWTKNCRE